VFYTGKTFTCSSSGKKNLSVEANIGMKTANLGLKEGGYEYASSFAQIKSPTDRSSSTKKKW